MVKNVVNISLENPKPSKSVENMTH